MADPAKGVPPSPPSKPAERSTPGVQQTQPKTGPAGSPTGAGTIKPNPAQPPQTSPKIPDYPSSRK